MTISSSNNKSGPYNGNGVTTVFARNFLVLSDDHLKVYQTVSGVTTEVTTGITKDGIGSDSGNVTFATAPSTGTQITLVREVPLTQETDYSSQGKVPPEQVEADFDLQEMQMQDLSEKTARSLKLPINSSMLDVEIPEPVSGRGIIGRSDNSGYELGPSSYEISNAQGYAIRAETAAISAETLLIRLPKTPYDFGAVGDGVSDDTQAIQDWLESGGALFGASGDYLVEAAGADSGGVLATISESTNVLCAANCTFKAGDGLDNDILRVVANPVGYTEKRSLNFSWDGGKFDQRDQKNSTSTPYISQYPLNNPGASATADALSIRGEISVSGTPTAGFYRVSVTNVQTIASNDGHWRLAGGDGAIFIHGSRHIDASKNHCIGTRDMAIYCSGLSSGFIPNGSCIIAQNKFTGCVFGAGTKRDLSNVQMVDNIGVNTAVVCTSTNVTETGDNVLIARNIGYGAWKVARATEGIGLTAYGNQSFKHGHLLEDGSVPTTVFHEHNACVSFEGNTKSTAYGNRLVGLNTGFTGVAATVLLGDEDVGSSTVNEVYSNTAEGCSNVVLEETSGGTAYADENRMWDNKGRNLTGEEVVLGGSSSINYDGPIYETNVTVNHTGTASSTTVATATIKQGWLTKDSRLVIVAAGDISGTSGGKTFSLKLGGAIQRSSPLFASSVEGEFYLEGKVDMNTTSSQRMFAQIIADNASGVIFSSENQDFDAGDIDIDLVFKLENSSDTMSLKTFSVRIE